MGGHSTSVADDAAASDLCTQCGLCCRGAIHNDVLLPREELSAGKALGLTVRDCGKTVFLLPCPRLEGNRCSVYDRRPSPCRQYRCQLLRHVDAGEIEMGEALGKVEIAKDLAKQAAAALPAGMTLPDARIAFVGQENTEPTRGAELHAEAKLRMIALLDYVDRHFMNDDDGKYFESTFAGERPAGSDA